MSFSKTKKEYGPRYYQYEDVFAVLKPMHEVIFQPREGGLYFHGTCHREVVLVNTVRKDMEGFTCRKIEGAKEAISGLARVGYPSEVDYNNIIRSEMIRNFPITPTDINTAHKIFGHDVSILKGKTLRKQPPASDGGISIHGNPKTHQRDDPKTNGGRGSDVFEWYLFHG